MTARETVNDYYRIRGRRFKAALVQMLRYQITGPGVSRGLIMSPAVRNTVLSKLPETAVRILGSPVFKEL